MTQADGRIIRMQQQIPCGNDRKKSNGSGKGKSRGKYQGDDRPGSRG